LGASEAIIREFRDIEVADLGDSSNVEDIGAFQIAMDDVIFMQAAESLEDGEGRSPYELFLESFWQMHLYSLLDHALEISPIRVLHDNAKCLRLGKKE
jgi:hypothetical protein